MPPRKNPSNLQSICTCTLGAKIIDLLLWIEKEDIYNLKGLQYSESLSDSDKLQNDYLALVEYIRFIPGVDYLALAEYIRFIPGILMEKVINSCLDIYKERFEKLEKGLRMGVLTKGAAAREDDKYFIPTKNINYVPTLTSVLDIMIQPNLLTLNLKKLSQLSSVSENVSSDFTSFLSTAMIKLPNLRSLTLSSHNSVNLLPHCTNEHLELIGRYCPELVFLDVSFNQNITGEGLRCLVPNEEKLQPGCVKLEKLYMFDCGVYNKDVAKVVCKFPYLTYLGYKETGKMLKTLFKSMENGEVEFQELKLTHVDNLGSKTRRLIAAALRCKRPVALAIKVLCPKVQNLKLRVVDDDIANLCSLSDIETVEFLYNNSRSPGQQTQRFFSVRGNQLTSIALICNTMSMVILSCIAENCANLKQLWSKSNELMAPYDEEDTVTEQHSYLKKLNVLYLSVGSGEFPTYTLTYVLPYVLRNAKGLTELVLAVRSLAIDDHYVQRLILDCELFQLETVMIVVPGLNSHRHRGILRLGVNTIHSLMDLCPNLRKLGNLLSWCVDKADVLEVEQIISEMNYDLELVNKKMTMR